MIEKFTKLLKFKGFFFIPIIGPLIYAIKINYFVAIQDKNFKKNVNFYKNIFSIISIVTVLPLMISFGVLRNTNNFGSFPWMFGVAITIICIQNLTPILYYYQYKLGLKKYKQKVENGTIEEVKPITGKEKSDLLDKEADRKKELKKNKKKK